MATSAQVDALVALYAGYFNRAPDPEGLQFWIDQIDGGREFNTIAADFAASEEATALYPYLTTPDVATPSTFITSIYQNLFNRAPEPEGLQFWTDVLESGAVSAADMIESIINGAIDAPDATPPTFDAATLENKIEVGRDFAEDAANTSGFEFDAEAKSAAVAAIDGVTNDEATVVDAKAATDTYLSGEANEGDTFTLTAGIDTVAGTASNDTITGTLEASDSTITPGDVIEGGAGVDRLNVVASDDADENDFAAIEVNDVEQFYFRNVSGTDLDLDMIGVSGADQLWIDRSTDEVSLDNVGFEFTVGFNKFGYNASANDNFDITVNDDVYAGSDDTLNVVLQSAGSINDGDYADLYLENDSGNDVIENMAIQSVSARSGDGNYLYWNDDSLTTDYTISGSADLELELSNASVVENVDASGLAADMTFTDNLTNASGVNYVGATGADDVTFGNGDNTIDTGAGDDMITIGSGNNTVNTGEGDDTVDLNGNNVSATSSINLGAGDDVVTGLGIVDKDASIDGGDGVDTLQLQAVGATNIGAFSNFEVFDVATLNKTLDLNILSAQNSVEEIVGSAATGANAALTNLGAGVGFRATGDMGSANDIVLTQATAGALDITLDADQAATSTADNDADTVVDATNATSVNVVFDTASANEIAGGISNTQTITLDTGAATTISVVSGGENAANVLALTDTSNASGESVLTEITVTGDQALDLSGISVTNTNNLATVDASGMTGGLIVELDDLANNAEVTLGSGADVVQAGVVGNVEADLESVVGFEKSASATDADLISEADLIDFGAAQTVGTGTATSDAAAADDGIVTFLGAGPSTLDEAIEFVDALGLGANQTVAFEYIGDTYVFTEGAAAEVGLGAGDAVVKLTGLTGVDALGVTGGDIFTV